MITLWRALPLFLFLSSLLMAEKAQEIDLEAEASRSFRDGLFLISRENYAAAAKKFKIAIEKDPKLAEAYNNYAYCVRKVSPENYAESLKYYGAALKLKPTLAVAYQYRGCLHTLMGNEDLAKRDLQTLRKLDPELAHTLEQFIANKGAVAKDEGYAEGY